MSARRLYFTCKSDRLIICVLVFSICHPNKKVSQHFAWEGWFRPVGQVQVTDWPISQSPRILRRIWSVLSLMHNIRVRTLPGNRPILPKCACCRKLVFEREQIVAPWEMSSSSTADSAKSLTWPSSPGVDESFNTMVDVAEVQPVAAGQHLGRIRYRRCTHSRFGNILWGKSEIIPSD